MFTTIETRDLILKAPLAIFNTQMHARKKSLKLSFRDFLFFLVAFLHRFEFNRYTLLFQTLMKKQWKGFIRRRRVKFNGKKISLASYRMRK